MPYSPELTTLGFVVSQDREHVLMVHRISRSDDEQLGKWNGLGGKVEIGEDIWSGMARELREEAGIEVVSMRLRGTVSWPGFHADGASVFGFVFIVDEWIGDIPERNAEGPLVWQPISGLADLPMWEGDRYFLPQTFDPEVEQFHLVIPYQDGRPLGWSGVVR
ncbi:8-oxo-dGTP diphosphatase [Propionimicrobium sp. PCR01-08-3]|uniref:NUDIX hydrolase n=1 Tax=Propionimicrobium sp. PCR01-08-3 TaxID=3052086 RepID=UPI00255C4770|nr:8-oxo-dGTP diphosphatase [Propionimicrobium sp. PCR01-08-3]WIY83253.1 8-oxo-dGTP diphosphatase [Propionimicrobium sp. PCR01-08-3]